MKRAVIRTRSIAVCLENALLATPIGPDSLRFEQDEQIVVALPLDEAEGAGEYQFLFTVGGYSGEDSKRAEGLYGRSQWRHFWSLSRVEAIEPFSLQDVVEDVLAAGQDGDEFHDYYKGRTNHWAIIRDIQPGDEDYFRRFVQITDSTSAAVTKIVADNAVVAHARGASTDSRDQILRKLKKLDRQNSGSSGGTRKPALRQNRNRRMAGLLKQLYGWKCQLCGLKLASPDARRHDIHVHHLDGWDGLRSDRLSNLVCVCPNHHALLGLGALQFREGRLLEWTDGAWVERKLEVDFHLGNAAGD